MRRALVITVFAVSSAVLGAAPARAKEANKPVAKESRKPVGKESSKPVAKASSAELRLARIWGKRYGLDEEQIEEQARAIGESGARTHGEHNEGHEVHRAYDFKYRTLSIPKGSKRKAIVMRSNQPAPENLAELAAAAAEVGIDPKQVTVINLRAENNVEASYHRHFAEYPTDKHEQAASQFTMLNLPILDHTIPRVDQVMDVLRAASDAKTKLLVLHCKAGRARTGVMVAAIRIALDGWSVEEALAEAAERGLTRTLQRRFIQQFAKDWKAGKLRLGKGKA